MQSEAVIRFACEHVRAPACEERDILELNEWRRKLRALRLVGRDPARYGGLGYGNLSRKLAGGELLITGSQTGHLQELTPAHFVRILDFDPDRNWIRSRGLVAPSSETLTHLAIYRSAAEAGFVFHAHCPEVWQARAELGLPMTDPKFECGTIELYHAVVELLHDPAVCRRRILVMGGHRDGVMSWGETADQAGSVLTEFLGAIEGRRRFVGAH